MDGRVHGWKLLAHLKLSQDCMELKHAWGEIVRNKGKMDAMPLYLQTRDELTHRLACELEPPASAVAAAAG